MLLSKKIFYAVEAVLYIAYNGGQGPISGRDIAARQNLPPRYLEQLMQKLVRGGVLRGVRGPHGGSLLARERRRITVGDICDILAEGGDENDFTNNSATPLGQQVVLPVWVAAREQMMQHLKHVNLADLCEQATAKSIRKDSEEHMDFAI